MERWKLLAPLLFILLALLQPAFLAKTALKRPGPGATVPAKRQKIVLPPNDWKNVATFNKAYNVALINAKNPDAIKAFQSALGHGGRYDALQKVVSKEELIESDHAPHYGILDYLDNVDDLPNGLKDDLKFRKKLKKDFKKAFKTFDANAKEIADLTKKIGDIENDFWLRKWKKISITDFPKDLETKYTKTVAEIKKAYKDRSKYGPGQLEVYVKSKLQELEAIRADARISIITSAATPGTKPSQKQLSDLVDLEDLENRKLQLEAMNKELERPLEDFKKKMSGKMGVLSIPYELHRLFPSTGEFGLDGPIIKLKKGSVGDAKVQLDDYKRFWKASMDNGLNNGYLQKSRAPPTSTNPADVDEYYHGLWKDNFKAIYNSWSTAPNPPTTAGDTFLAKLRKDYARYWMTRVIHAAKGKDFKGLSKLYISEYELYLGSDFNYYKKGIAAQLGANEKVGLLKGSDVAELITEHGLDTGIKNYKRWADTENLIQKQTVSVLTKAAFKPRNDPRKTLPLSCFKLRLGQVAGDNCIFTVQGKGGEIGYVDDEGSIFPKAQVIEDGHEIVTIDGLKLSQYLESFRGRELTLEETKARESVVELVNENKVKLVGEGEVVRKTKALLNQELLNIHNNQVRLSRSFGRDSELSAVPLETISNYDRVKIGMSNFAGKASKVALAADEVGGAYGKIMLATGIVTALRNQDYTGLEILGGRVGLDVGLQAIEKTGSLMAQKLGSQILVRIGSRMSSFVGRMAGPIGALADIGISIYSLSNSIKALRNPAASKWEQNDAIADIVSDSINIAVTATVAVLSIAFPPLAPILAVVALVVNVIGGLAVAAVRAADHVAALNEEVPLLEWEKREEYVRSFNGRNTSRYLEDIIKTKAYNNALANQTMLWLKANPDFETIFVPSKTLKNGVCHLDEIIETGQFTRPGGRWECGTAGSGQACSGAPNGYNCGHHQYSEYVVNVVDVHIFDCTCEPPHPDDFSEYDVLNNVLDLSRQQSVYEERAAPNFLLPDSTYSYYCKPNSLSYNTLTSVATPVSGHLCQGILGMQHSVPGAAAHLWMYDLKSGDDTIILGSEDVTESLFQVGDGHKNFQGGGGDDTFQLLGNCTSLTGRLDGGGYAKSGNTLVLSDDCGRGGTIDLNLVSGTMVSPGGGSGSIQIAHMENIIGRKDQSEVIRTSCGTKYVDGKGGDGGNHKDRIVLPTCSQTNPANTTILAEGQTSLDFTNFKGGLVAVFVNAKVELDAQIEMTPKSEGSASSEIYFKFEKVGGLVSARLVEGDPRPTQTSASSYRHLNLEMGNGGWADFTFHCLHPECESDTEVALLFSEVGQLPIQLLVNLQPLELHALWRVDSSHNPATRTVEGLPFLENWFYLESGGDWGIKGSPDRNDIFFLRNSSFGGSVDGGGGFNTLAVSIPSTDPVSIGIDQVIVPQSSSALRFSNIQSILGRVRAPENVTLGCGMRQLNLRGGSETSPDSISINNRLQPSCSFDATILAQGKTVVNSDGMNRGRLVVQVGPVGNETDYSSDLRLEVDGRGTAAKIFILLNYKISQLSAISSKSSSEFEIALPSSKTNVVGQFRSTDGILFPPNSATGVATVIAKTEGGGGDFIAFHNLTKDPATGGGQVKGIPFLENRFSISTGDWNVVLDPSEKNNVFLLTTPSISGSLDGGGGGGTGISKIIIPSNKDWPNSITIDSNGGMGALSTKNIGAWEGRPGFQEMLTVSPVIKYISLGGGSKGQPDIISMADNGGGGPGLNRNLTIVASGATSLLCARDGSYTSGGSGNIDIYIQPEANGSLQFTGSFALAKDSLRWKLAIKIPPYKISSISVLHPSSGIFTINLSLQSEPGKEENFIKIDTFPAKPDLNSTLLEEFPIILISESYQVLGRLLIDETSGAAQLLNFVSDDFRGQDAHGAIGISNVFKLSGKRRQIHGGKLDDIFIIEDDTFAGTIHGYGGQNTLILSDSLNSTEISFGVEFTAPRDRREVLYLNSPSNEGSISVNSIQAVVGRKGKREQMFLNDDCAIKLVRLEGGSGPTMPDEVFISSRYCFQEMTILASNYTLVANLASFGNFSYVVEAPETFEIRDYNLGQGISHSFTFRVEELAEIKSASVSDGNLEINFNGVVKSFRVFEASGGKTMVPKFQFITNTGLVADLVLEGTDNHPSNIRATILTPSSYSGGKVVGIPGMLNDILVYSEGELGSISGAEEDDSIFLFESTTSIQEINGGKGEGNRLQLMPGFWPGSELEIDLRSNDSSTSGISLVFRNENATISEVDVFMIAGKIQNIQIFVGREYPEFERVTLNCDTVLVAQAEEILVPDSGCNYDTRFILGKGARVRFTLTDDYPTTNYTCSSLEDEDEDSCEEITEDDSPTDFATYNSSIFYYDFLEPCNFDVEVDSFSRLGDTRHIFNLKFNLSDIQTIVVDQNENGTTRLVYSLHIHSSPGLEYSHLLGNLYESEMFYSQPEFMTEDGFNILVTKFGQVLISFGNLEETLDKGDITSGFVPRLAELGFRLGVNSIIETKADFIYSGNPREVSTLSNRENVTSHLIGWNGTNYQIFAGVGDVLLYPQGSGPQIIDLTDIIAQIPRKDNYSLFIPDVTQLGSDLVIDFSKSGHSDIFPGKIQIVNGTTFAAQGGIKVLLRTVAMNLTSGAGGNWEMVPGRVTISRGHVLHLDADDLDTITEIHDELANATYSCAREGDALIVSNIHSFHQVFDQDHPTLPTSFVIANLYGNPDAEAVMAKISLNLGGQGNGSLCGQEINGMRARARNFIVGSVAPRYSDILIQTESEILAGFPGISKMFNATTLNYYN